MVLFLSCSLFPLISGVPMIDHGSLAYPYAGSAMVWCSCKGQKWECDINKSCQGNCANIKKRAKQIDYESISRC